MATRIGMAMEMSQHNTCANDGLTLGVDNTPLDSTPGLELECGWLCAREVLNTPVLWRKIIGFDSQYPLTELDVCEAKSAVRIGRHGGMLTVLLNGAVCQTW